jgi:hypothetical protein
MPFLATIEGTYAFGRNVPTVDTGVPFQVLNTIAVYLRNYMADFRNPSFYNYRCDGSGFFINDGGGDMYDNGNVTTPWLRSGLTYVGTGVYSAAAYPSAITYTNNTRTLVDTDMYYISLGYTQYTSVQDPTFLPLTVLGSRSGVGAPVGWQIGGNSGADGGGTLASGILYNAASLNGFTVHAFYRETYAAAGDPSHCNLFILLGHPNWASVFGTITSFADPVNNGGCGGFFYTSGAGVQNILAIQTLLSKNSGVLVTAAECQTVVQNFTLRIKQALGY